MTRVVLDTGALIGLDRQRRNVWALLRVAVDQRLLVQVPAGAVGQAWRDGARQVQLVRALRHCQEVPLDGPLARAAGVLCGVAQTRDVVDASVAIVAVGSGADDASLVSSDPADMTALLGALHGRRVNVVPV